MASSNNNDVVCSIETRGKANNKQYHFCRHNVKMTINAELKKSQVTINTIMNINVALLPHCACVKC